MTRRNTDGDDRKRQDHRAQRRQNNRGKPQNNGNEPARRQLAERQRQHAQTGRERWRQENALGIQLAVEQFDPLTEAAVKGMQGYACELCGGRFEAGDVCAPLPIETPPAEAESALCAVVHKSCKDRARREALEAEARLYLGMIQ